MTVESKPTPGTVHATNGVGKLPASTFHAQDWAVVAALMAAVWAVFGRTVGFDYVIIDDTIQITKNSVVQEGLTWRGLRYAFTQTPDGNFMPVTWLSHMAVIEVAGREPAAAHAMNVALHSVVAALVYLFWRLATGAAGRSAVVAGLFALHPLRVESVAWVAERKDVLSGFFWMLSLLAYLAYAQRPGAVRYAALVVCFAFGLLSKSMVVTLPCVLLLLDWWPLDRWRNSGTRRVLIEKLPLFALSASCAVATFFAQRAVGAMSNTESVPLVSRLWNAPSSYGTYLLQTIWPFDLAVMYPYLNARDLLLRGLAGGAAMAVIFAIAFVQRGRRPYLSVGWLWYLGTLVPVIGLVQVGFQAHADRYTYLPQIGLLVAGVWAAAQLFDQTRLARREKVAIGMGLVILCAGVAWRQTGFWRDSETLLKHAMAVTKPNAFTERSYAIELIDRKEYPRAEEHMRRAMQIEPPHPSDFHNLGNLLFVQGKTEEAQYYLTLAVLNDPALKESWALLGDIRLGSGQADAAADAYRKALDLGSDGWELRANLARALARSSRPAEAAAEFEAALQSAPGSSRILLDYGGLLVEQADVTQAAPLLERGLAGDPENPEGLYNLGLCRVSQGRVEEAAALLARAFSREPSLRERAVREPLLDAARSSPAFRLLLDKR